MTFTPPAAATDPAGSFSPATARSAYPSPLKSVMVGGMIVSRTLEPWPAAEAGVNPTMTAPEIRAAVTNRLPKRGRRLVIAMGS